MSIANATASNGTAPSLEHGPAAIDVKTAVESPGCDEARALVRPEPLAGDDPLDHICYVLGNTQKRTWPYPHYVCNNVFPPAFYAKMLELFPTDDELYPLNDVFPKRLSRRIGIPDELDAIDDPKRTFWRELGLRLGSESFMRFVLRQYDPVLEDRFGEVVEPHIYLHSDIEGYGIGPHVDIHDKVVSMVFYLPDRPMPELNAACVMTKTDPDKEIQHPKEEDWVGYRSVFQPDYVPNMLFTFAVTHNSWHGVRPNPHGVPRRSLQYFIKLPFKG
ncbi:MAG: hypothetical protein AAF235_05985 [Planctomycetota bacterium]